MNLEEYQAAWQAPRPAPLNAQAEVETLVRRLARSEHRSRILLRVLALNTVVCLLLTLFVLVNRQPLAWREVVPAVGLQLILGMALLRLIRRQQARRRAIESAGATVQGSARTALSTVASQIGDIRLLLALLGVVVPLLAWTVYQLMDSGKMNAQAAFGFAATCTVILGVNGAVQWHKYRRVLTPRRKRLEQLIASIEDES